ncbi:MAG: ChaN family lipoprotein, partial [Planctomycetes bacterium]|nr:ChaN family lipoprotein [Planctomycetota bacterium]
SGTPEERLYDTQNLWDNSMGDNVSKARIAHPDSIVLHVAGGFHVAYRDGTVAQFARRSPDSKFATAEISPTSGLHLVRPERDVAQADFLIYAEAHARDLNDGTYAVEVPAELRYRLDVPEGKANLPMLVWLPDHATRSEDAFAYWQATLAADAALAVVEAPFPEVQDDLAIGGRYAAGDGFRGDYTRMQQGLARIVEYVTRRFPVDAERVVIAGTGDGGAVVLWTAMYGEWLPVDMLAIDPTDLTRLSMEALPDLKPVARSLQLRTLGSDTTRLEKVAADYTKLGLSTTTSSLEPQAEALPNQVRTMLGLAATQKPVSAAGPMRLELANDLPRAREWAELYATQATQKTVVVGPRTEDTGRRTLLAVGGDGHWPVASFASGAGLPLAGGPFGGTTVVVLPKGISDADRATWLAHEKNKVIKRRSMFANIAIASAEGEPTLPQVMADLKKRGRSRVLIVPAVFCADAATMRSLKEQLGDAAAGMDVSWLPGLGGELARGSH